MYVALHNNADCPIIAGKRSHPMSWFESVSPKSSMSDGAKPMFNPQTASMAHLGAMSPLWMMFMGASTAGMAYWGMTRWMRLATPEAITENVVKLRLVKSSPAPVVDAVQAEVAAVVDAVEIVAEAAPTPEAVLAVTETVAEAIIEPVLAVVAEPV
jgi:hypothetical protein